ncbi:MAG: translation initiation factor IF-3 [Clostridia bacterium]|nr:translation initiation factor IF-3 [Clostridia bacterium]
MQKCHGYIYVGVCCVRRLVFAQFFLLFCKNGGVFNISTKELMINEEIKAKEVRVIGVEGEAIGVMSSDDALKLAYDKGYDLVLMAPQAQPPVCRIMDYGKYRFERDKKEKEAKKKQQVIELKEIQLSCRIDTHDFETKARHAQKFLESGNKVRVVMRFKGREMSHMAIGQEIMKKFEEACSEYGNIDKAPVLDGRLLSMVVSPLKK